MKYIFIHIGKTAGTSFRSFLESNVRPAYFGYGKLYFLTDVRSTPKFLESEPNGMAIFDHFNLFSEHFAYGLHPYLKTKEYQYIAVLREPLSRTMSAHRYAKDRGWITEETSILDWFNDKKNKDQLNYQINHVSGVPDDVDVEVKKKIGLDNLRGEKFLFGFTEEYNDFIRLCCKINNWSPQFKETNKTQSKGNVSDEDKETLKGLLSDEIEFYNQARIIHKEKYKDD